MLQLIEKLKPKIKITAADIHREFIDTIPVEWRIVSGYKIVDNDPIVLFPVWGGYLIVTKWGDEKKVDELIVKKME